MNPLQMGIPIVTRNEKNSQHSSYEFPPTENMFGKQRYVLSICDAL